MFVELEIRRQWWESRHSPKGDPTTADRGTEQQRRAEKRSAFRHGGSHRVGGIRFALPPYGLQRWDGAWTRDAHGAADELIRSICVKIDQDYLKKLLQACQASEKPTFDIEDLKAAGFDYNDPQFEFHMMILTDQGFIEQDDCAPGFGLTKSLDGYLSWAVLPLRLTAAGHQFIEALSNREVWAAIKHGFKDASIATLKSVSLKLLEGYAQKKIEKLLC